MARPRNKLPGNAVRQYTAKGRYSDGGGLYLRVLKDDAPGFWAFRYTRHKQNVELSLGSVLDVSLSAARDIASDLRAEKLAGRDPRALLRPTAPKTFLEAAETFLERHLADIPGQRPMNPVSKHQWQKDVHTRFKKLHHIPVADVTSDDCVKVLKPDWRGTPESSRRARGRLAKILDHAKSAGWRSGDNPASMNGGLEALLPPMPKKKVNHFRALPYKDAPALWQALQSRRGTSARALELTMLTASRPTEAREALWSEMDLEEGIWEIEGVRMKRERNHIVPLPTQLIETLSQLREVSNGPYVFPGMKQGRPLSSTGVDNCLRRIGWMGRTTVHGLRSTFRDWHGEETAFADELGELALSHVRGDAAYKAYRRGSAVEKRRQLMQAWADYVTGSEAAGEIIPLRGAG